MWRQYNPNPYGSRVGDCTIRALTKALGKEWHDVYIDLAVEGLLMGDMPSSNAVWGNFLKKNGFKRQIVDNECPTCYTLNDFCRDHPAGTCVVALNGHVVCVCDGEYYDSWQSGDEIPIYYFTKGE